MFWRKPREPDNRSEIISPGEAITWQEDESVTQRRRTRRGGMLVAVAGVMLVLLIIGARIGIFSSLAASTW
jgi:hypothetical protein